MKFFRSHDVPHASADPQSFVGPAQTKKLAQADDGAPVVVYHVKFEPGARMNSLTEPPIFFKGPLICENEKSGVG